MSNTVKLKRGTATQWAVNNPVLASGEVGVELSVSGTPQAVKVGDGTSAWNSLAYLVKPANTNPAPIVFGGSGSAGNSREFARADHVHAAPSGGSGVSLADVKAMLLTGTVDVADIRSLAYIYIYRSASGEIETVWKNDREIEIFRDADGLIEAMQDSDHLWLFFRDANGISSIEYY